MDGGRDAGREGGRERGSEDWRFEDEMEVLIPMHDHIISKPKTKCQSKHSLDPPP